MKSKSTTGEVVASALLTMAIAGCAVGYLEDGARGWVVAALAAVVLLVAVVAGVAER